MNIEKLAAETLAKYWTQRTLPVEPQQIIDGMRLKVVCEKGASNKITSEFGKIQCVYTDDEQRKMGLSFIIGRIVLNGILDRFHFEENEWMHSDDPKNTKAKHFSKIILNPALLKS